MWVQCCRCAGQVSYRSYWTRHILEVRLGSRHTDLLPALRCIHCLLGTVSLASCLLGPSSATLQSDAALQHRGCQGGTKLCQEQPHLLGSVGAGVEDAPWSHQRERHQRDHQVHDGRHHQHAAVSGPHPVPQRPACHLRGARSHREVRLQSPVLRCHQVTCKDEVRQSVTSLRRGDTVVILTCHTPAFMLLSAGHCTPWMQASEGCWLCGSHRGSEEDCMEAIRFRARASAIPSVALGHDSKRRNASAHTVVPPGVLTPMSCVQTCTTWQAVAHPSSVKLSAHLFMACTILRTSVVCKVSASIL